MTFHNLLAQPLIVNGTGVTNAFADELLQLIRRYRDVLYTEQVFFVDKTGQQAWRVVDFYRQIKQRYAMQIICQILAFMLFVNVCGFAHVLLVFGRVDTQ
eukprot:TRINITY_DN6349_c0_g1_i2.p2 TRINITY_DN6349_c0_g1~~TRINITY_DN6349_c0_g1_i2.p2  ORF type:complete len:100 (+),score=3.93 TRINITY_DN6349_c0_g1_i2:605-904(+)